jgi:hypothetical protein
MVKDSAVYGIAVINHGSWTNKELLEKVQACWPDTIAKHKMPDGYELEQSISESEHAELRKAGIVAPVELRNGAVYMPPGGGFNSTAASSVQASMWMNRAIETIRNYQDFVIENIEEFVANCAAKGGAVTPPYQFQLYLQNGACYALETTTKTMYKLGDAP